MRILIAASEMEPFASTGDFGAAIAAQAGELAALGHEVSVVLPHYRSGRDAGRSRTKKTGVSFTVPLGGGRVPCTIRETRAPSGVQVFLVERDEFFDRSGLYGGEDGDYQDNAARFIYFSKCVVELARQLDPAPDIIHAHNWQAAFIPLLVADQRLPMRTVFSAHSLEYQGNFWSYDFGLTNLSPHYFSPRGMEYYGSMNLLKTGILFADAVVLPGPRWVFEAQTARYGSGLEPVLREQARKLEGILPGMNLPAPHADSSARSQWLRQAEFDGDGLQLLLATDSMTSDGMEILLPALDRLMESGVRLAILGRVHPSSLAGVEFARRQHAGRFTWFPDCEESTLATALAGSDALLCPAPIAPDSSTLVRALLQGLIPIVQSCGGLHFLAPAWSPADDQGFSFHFHGSTPEALVDAVRAADDARSTPAVWSLLRSRAASRSFTWAENAAATELLYAAILARFGMLRAA